MRKLRPEVQAIGLSLGVMIPVTILYFWTLGNFLKAFERVDKANCNGVKVEKCDRVDE